MIDSLVINPKSKNVEKVLQFINWVQSNQENYDSLIYGIQGKHYLLEGERVKPVHDEDLQGSIYSWQWCWPIKNINFDRFLATSPVDTQQKYREIILTKTEYPPHLGFTPDYGVVQDIVTLRRRSFASVEQKIYSGMFTAEDVDTYIRDNKTRGTDQLVIEIQKQLDQWKSKN
jgi:putative aldouronate transport system substrate-binding protein